MCHPISWTRASGTHSNGSSRHSTWIGGLARRLSKTVIWSTAMSGLHLNSGPARGFRQGPGSPPASSSPGLSRRSRRASSSSSAASTRCRTSGYRESHRRFGTKSTVMVPLRRRGPTAWRSGIDAVRAERSWPASHRGPSAARCQYKFAGMLARRRADESLRAALVQVSHLTDQLQVENVCLRKEDAREHTDTGLVTGECPAVASGRGTDTAGRVHQFDGAASRGDGQRQGDVRDPDP